MHEAHDIAIIHMAVKGRVHLHRHTADEHQAVLYLLFYMCCHVRLIWGLQLSVSGLRRSQIPGGTSSPALISRRA